MLNSAPSIAVEQRHEPLGDVHDGALALIGELGIELLRDLAEHEPEVDVAARQDDVMEVEARDVEELLDQAVETVRLLQGHARETHPLLLGKIGGLVQQREVAHDARERRLEVVRQIGHQIVLAGSIRPEAPAPQDARVPHPIERAFDLKIVAVQVVPVIRMLDQAIDHVAGDGFVRLLSAADASVRICRERAENSAAHTARASRKPQKTKM